ncbi:TRAP transporter substrate-binding protein DctP [Pseudomonas benzenivorans]|uniref:TRAP transporter substrate-binding protein DctP n=1 Tax=Pseudomonas benzenivorans TaxID=556533 RepID=A0ABY5H6S2_9PSED|nr:TRAP transporter substrate-binding protein DctP [Pseudomonas benzenivorans]UTW08011.1 TRAP transporter substrate-binding protein DctP [Pseudomonas benzenivorans]
MKITRSIEKSTLAIAGAVLMAAAVIAPSAVASEKVVLAHAMSKEHIFNQVADKFLASLDKNAPGQFDVEYHPGGDLGDWTSQFEQTISGEIGMTMTFPATDFDPRLNISIMGMVANSWEEAANIYGPGGSMVKVYDEIYSGLNMKLLAILPIDFGGVAMRKGSGKVPVNFPEDGAGIKVRVPPMQTAIKRFEYLGFNPVPMPFSELYTALQLGAVDGRSFGPPSEIWQMRDVLETYVFTRDYFEQGAFLVNKDWWEGLDADQQAKVQGAADEAAAWAWKEAESISSGLIANIKNHGINVVELNPAQQEKMSSIIQEKEWSWMEATVGKDLVDQIRATTKSK